MPVTSVPPLLLARGVAAARIGLGAAMLAAPDRLTRTWLGRDATRAPTQVAVRALAARDLVLGAGALFSGGAEQQRWLTAGIAADLAATLAAGGALPLAGRALITAVAAGAVALDAVAVARLRAA